MRVGIPKEIKNKESRVALVPAGAAAFVQHGHTVLVEKGAGLGSGVEDDAYRAAGAEIVSDPESLWATSDMVMKVKEPLREELGWLREDLILYTYLHLASAPELTEALLQSKVCAVGYETIQSDDGSLPLLIPMSEVAGRLSVQKGAYCLEAGPGGQGMLLSGVSGVRPANVVILGAGIAGCNACQGAVGMGAHVSILDIDPARLRYIHDIMGGHVTTVMANSANITEEVLQADLVITAALRAGARAPVLIDRDLVKRMRPGAAIVDIAIDQGGCCETSRPTSHEEPTFMEEGVVHYCVTNMPGAVPKTATWALTNVTLQHGLELADHGQDALSNPTTPLGRGLNTWRGKVTHEAVANALGLPHEAR